MGLPLALAAAPALASGFDVPAIGNLQSGPVTKDAAATYYNPAQLAHLDRVHFQAGGQLIAGRLAYQRDYLGTYQYGDSLQFAEPIDPAYLDPVKSGSSAAEVSDTIVAPSAYGFLGIPLVRDRLVLGLGLYVPYAAILEFPQDGPQRYQVQEALVASANIEAALGVRLHDKVSLGAGVSYVLSVIELSRIQDFAAVQEFSDALAQPPINQANDYGPDAPTTVRELDVLGRPVTVQKAISHGITFNAGLAAEPTERLDLALVYQHSTRVVARGNFVLDMSDDLFTQDLAAQGLQYPDVVNGKATVRFTLPNKITLGAGYDIGEKKRFRIDGHFEYALWRRLSEFAISLDSEELAQPELGVPSTASLSIPRDFQDAIGVEVNGRFQATERVLASGTLGFASNATPDETIDLTSPDGNRVIFGGGVVLGVGKRKRAEILIDAIFNAVIPRKITTSNYDLGNGTYRLFLSTIGVHGRFKFGKGKKKDV